jgi:hypothetical protein
MRIREYRKTLSALLEGRTHPLPCECAACLYDLYRRSQKSRRGQPYQKHLFYLNYLIHEVVLDTLKRKGKIEKEFIYGKIRQKIPIREKGDLRVFIPKDGSRRVIQTPYDRASYYLEVHEILKRLLEGEKREEYVRFLQGLIRSKNYFHRAEAEGFRDLIGELNKKRLSSIQSGLSPILSKEEIDNLSSIS